jgi:hypothetical protein
MRYLLSVDAQPLTVTAAPSRTDPGDLDYDVAPWAASGDVIVVPLMHYSQLVDFAYDDRNELRQSGLPASWASAFGDMTRESREVYKEAVQNIRYVPPALNKLKPMKYARMLAAHGTYDWFTGGYFGKWKPGKELHEPTPATFSDDFLRATTDEVRLARGHDYLMVASQASYQLFEVIRRPAGDLVLHEVLGGYGTAHGDLDWKEPRTVVLFHSIDGVAEFKQRSQRVYHVDRPQGGYRLLLDPRGMVQDVATTSGAGLIGLNDSFDWFVEMCATFFRNPIQPVDLGHLPDLVQSPSYQMLKRELDATASSLMDGLKGLGDFSAELTVERRKQVEALLARPEVLIFTQGMPISDTTRLVGADASWVYLRDLTDGSVFALHLTEFVQNWRIVTISKQVYEGSAGVIPLLKFLFALAAMAFAAPVALSHTTAISVRTVVHELTVGELTSMAMKRIAKFLAPALAAEMTVLVLSLFEKAGHSNDLSRRWKAFAEGFFEGYIVHTLQDEFLSKLSVDNLPGPKAYRAYQMVKRAYHAVNKVQEVVTLLENELDTPAAKRGVAIFEKAMTRTVRGSLLLISALYYIHEDDLGAIMDGYAGDPDVAPPEAAIWHHESAKQIAEMARNLPARDRGRRRQVDGFFAALDGTKPYVFGAAVLFNLNTGVSMEVAKALGRQTIRAWEARPEAMKRLEEKVAKALTHPTVLKVVGGLLLASGIVHEVSTRGKGIRRSATRCRPWRRSSSRSWRSWSPSGRGRRRRAKVHGELTGSLLGAFMFNRFLFGSEDEVAEAKKAGHPHVGQRWIKLMDEPWAGSMVQRKLKVGVIGPFLKVFLKRYLSLFEQVRKHGHFQDRQHTLETFGRLLTVGEDAALSSQRLERLAKFRTHEESVSFSLAELVKILFRLRTMIGKDLADYLKERHERDGLAPQDFLPVEVSKLIAAAETLGLPELVEKYSRELYVVMSAHIVMALNELEGALDALFEPFTQSRRSWMDLLSELGFDVGDLDAVLREFDTAAKDRMAAFKAAGAPP